MADRSGLVVTSQHQGDAFTITTFIRPRRDGGPNVGCYSAVMSLLATVVPDAYDPQPQVAEQIALADGVTATGAGLLPEAHSRELLVAMTAAAQARGEYGA